MEKTFAYQMADDRQYPFGYAANPEKFSIFANAITMEEILPAAGLDWTMREGVLYDDLGVVETHKTIIREDTNTRIGVVGRGYYVTQHQEELGIFPDLMGEKATFAGGGCMKGGQKVWLQAHVSEKFKILNDEMESFLVLVDTHDGSGSMVVYLTDWRIWCKNRINPTMKQAKHKFFLRHTRNIMSRLDEIKRIYFSMDQYHVELAEYAEEMFRKKVSDAEVKRMLNSIFPVDEKASDLVKRKAEEKKEAFYICYAAPDIAKFQGTAWGVIQAASDLVCHSLPHKATKEWNENNWDRILSGHPVFDKVVNYLA